MFRIKLKKKKQEVDEEVSEIVKIFDEKLLDKMSKELEQHTEALVRRAKDAAFTMLEKDLSKLAAELGIKMQKQAASLEDLSEKYEVIIEVSIKADCPNCGCGRQENVRNRYRN